ncbi:MAG: formate transporter FocA [Actinomycetia bacterium]|nr:formate transporter FocA [Actinomycetes bacterium]
MNDTAGGLDALLPGDMARKAEQVGVNKVGASPVSTFVLAVLAGAFISLGAVFATVATSGDLDPGLSRVLGGLTFCLGLVLVIGAGAELFTGNALIMMAAASRKVTLTALLRNWGIVYAGNVAGALATAMLVVWSGHHELGAGAVGDTAMSIANAKVEMTWLEALLRGILANALVCLAVWLSFAARTLTDRIMAVLFPITAFVAAGFEHSIANLYFLPAALFLKSDSDLSYWDTTTAGPEDHPAITWSGFITDNLIPVTIGNMIGGGVLVALVYWFVYLGPRSPGDPGRRERAS